MIEIGVWTKTFLQALRQTFGERLWFVGLQGSYGRGEATESSDIDVVVILTQLSAADIRRYRAMLDTLPRRELVCGFLSGRDELLRWEPSDLFQFYHDTTPLLGSLNELLVQIDVHAVDQAIHLGACNLYHACVHNMVHEHSDEILRGLYKAASFVIQACCFRRTGSYQPHLRELLACAQPQEQALLYTFLELKRGAPVVFDAMSDALFTWAQALIRQTALSPAEPKGCESTW